MVKDPMNWAQIKQITSLYQKENNNAGCKQTFFKRFSQIDSYQEAPFTCTKRDKEILCNVMKQFHFCRDLAPNQFMHG